MTNLNRQRNGRDTSEAIALLRRLAAEKPKPMSESSEIDALHGKEIEDQSSIRYDETSLRRQRFRRQSSNVLFNTSHKPKTDQQQDSEQTNDSYQDNQLIDDGQQTSRRVTSSSQYDQVSGDAQQDTIQRDSKRRSSKWKGLLWGVLISACVITGSAFYIADNLSPVNSKDMTEISVKIEEGNSDKAIAQVLEEKHLIKNKTVFLGYLKVTGAKPMQQGTFTLKPSMSVKEIVDTLTTTSGLTGNVRIIEGYTIDQIADTILENVSDKGDKKSPFTKEEFLKVIQDDTFIASMVAKYPRLLASLPAKDSGVRYQLEGYLHPATYEYDQTTTCEAMIDKMLAASDAALEPYYDQIKASGKTVNDVLTLASLVEKEGESEEDRKEIAGVFENRLALGMPLQSNIALLYAQGRLGQTISLQEDVTLDTNMDSPYNTYLNAGLMPGAVDNPSIGAIKAIIYPNQTDNLYFLADIATKKVYFSKTKEEHDANVEKYITSQIS